MNRRVLQILGALALVGTAAASVAALLTVREHLHVTIAGETSAQKAGPDPLALLKDDVAGLRADLSAVAQALGKNFEALAAREDDSTAHAAEALAAALSPLRADLARLSERVDGAGAASADRADAARKDVLAVLSAVSSRLDRLAAERASAPPPAATGSAPFGASGPSTTPPPAPRAPP